MTAGQTSYDAAYALRAGGLLRTFNQARVLSAADVHLARRLAVMGGETDEAVLLATALVVRSTRHGSVVVDLATAAETAVPDEAAEGDEEQAAAPSLPWPDDWVARCAASPLLTGPLRLRGSRLWLTRYWDQEEQVAATLTERTAQRPADLDHGLLASGLARLFPRAEDADQRLAAACCALSTVSVLAGGPGTGKTTTVSRLLALLREQDPGARIALAAPTGKAAARLEEAVRSSAAALSPEDRARVGDPAATTLHRLLGWRPDARSRFRHDRTNRLPYDVVVVDEASMVSLTMMARLLEALRPQTRLVLVGDPDQLASIEAGAVLGDLVDRAALGQRTAAFADAIRAVLPGVEVAETPDSSTARLRDGISQLTTSRRFEGGGGIDALAAAVRDGRAEEVLERLRAGGPEVEWVDVPDDERPDEAATAGLRADVVGCGSALHTAALGGDATTAVAALDGHRLLCAHGVGPRGARHWSAVAEAWLADALPGWSGRRSGAHYPGEALLVTTNDYEVGVYNGDVGVVVALPDGSGEHDGPPRLAAAFARGGDPFVVPLARLGAVRSLQAMTVHRSQGSQFDRTTVLLPRAASPLATRETLYTALTRARLHVRVIGSADALLACVGRPAARATGLRERFGASAPDSLG